MTPKEKALQLIEEFWTEVEDNDYVSRKMSYIQAKKCALIAVDEIVLNSKWVYEECFNHKQWNGALYDLIMVDRKMKYWQEVKQEIEKL